MPQAGPPVRFADPSTSLQLASVTSLLPDEYLREVENQVRAILLPRLRALTPKESGSLAASYRVLPIRRIGEGVQNPVVDIVYAHYGDWVDFREPIHIGGVRVEKVPDLIRAVYLANASEIYTAALRTVASRYGVEIPDAASIRSEITSFIVRRLAAAYSAGLRHQYRRS